VILMLVTVALGYELTPYSTHSGLNNISCIIITHVPLGAWA